MHPARQPANKGKRAHDHPAEPPNPPAKAHKYQASTLDHHSEPPGPPAKAHTRQAKTHKSQAEAPKRPAKTAPWVEEYKSWAKAQNRPAEARNRPNGPYCDIYTCIHIEEVEADAANDDIDGDEVADCAKYYMHSGQMFCVTCWACPDCRHHCYLIGQHILHESSHVIIQMHINQLRQHLINSSRYPVAI